MGLPLAFDLSCAGSTERATGSRDFPPGGCPSRDHLRGRCGHPPDAGL